MRGASSAEILSSGSGSASASPAARARGGPGAAGDLLDQAVPGAAVGTASQPLGRDEPAALAEVAALLAHAGHPRVARGAGACPRWTASVRGAAGVHPRDPRSDAAENFVGNRFGVRCEFVGRDPLRPLAAEQHDLVADGDPRDAGDVDEAQIHADGADHRSASTAHEDAGAVREGAAVTVRVADRERRDQALASRREGAAVAQRRAGRDALEKGDRGREAHHRAQIAGAGETGSGRGAVQHDPRAHQIPGRVAEQHQRAVGDVPPAHGAGDRLDGAADRVEGRDLTGGHRAVAPLGLAGVGHDPLEDEVREVAEPGDERQRVRGGDADPAHAGVDLEVDGDPPARVPRRAFERLGVGERVQGQRAAEPRPSRRHDRGRPR